MYKNYINHVILFQIIQVLILIKKRNVLTVTKNAFNHETFHRYVLLKKNGMRFSGFKRYKTMMFSNFYNYFMLDCNGLS